MGTMIVLLPQGLDRNERLPTACTPPVVAKLGPPDPCPLDDQAACPPRKFPGNHCEALDIDRGLVIAIAGVKMRPTLVTHLVVNIQIVMP
jgi:hypothetical protein